ncbi:MAG: hypothetical protein M1839_000541 [Geoglossum umbratile]|nr:MAG: hypothetical protein M1839_000541 [Geoglossum umbratile]
MRSAHPVTLSGARGSRCEPPNGRGQCSSQLPPVAPQALFNISYKWGISQQCHRVLVGDNHYMDVSGTVRDILLCLRPEASEGPSLFWIDQLCINQNDSDEKWEQIRMMRKIYSHAVGTLLILAGNSEEFDPFLFQLHLFNLKPLRSRPSGLYPTRPGEPLSLARAWSREEVPEYIQLLFKSGLFREHSRLLLRTPFSEEFGSTKRL